MITGVILAGGRSSRMGGGDKCLHLLGGRPLLWHVIERLVPQVDAAVLNANGDPLRFLGFGLPVAADPIEGFAGPLAGILAGMHWARANAPDCTCVVGVAGDTPYFPADLVARLCDGPADEIAIAHSSSGPHWVFGLFPLQLADDLERAIADGSRKVADWVSKHPYRLVEFTSTAQGDPFFNINTPADLAMAETLWTALDT